MSTQPAFQRPLGPNVIRIVDPKVAVTAPQTRQPAVAVANGANSEIADTGHGNSAHRARTPQATRHDYPKPSNPYASRNLASKQPLRHGNPESDEAVNRAFDVYAMPFVPEALRMINYLPGVLHPTPPRRNIDFAEYAHLIFPSGLQVTLHNPPMTYLPRPETARLGPPSESLSPSSYEKFFRRCLEDELEAQKRVNETYSLYNQKIRIVFEQADTGYASLSIPVPGLRENTPFVEEDDVVELRQLVHERSGRLHGTDHYIAAYSPRRENYHRLTNVPGWTSVVYHGRVTAVIKNADTGSLAVLVAGLPAINFGLGYRYAKPIPLDLHFNVRFLVPASKHTAQQLAMSVAQRTLTNDSRAHDDEDDAEQPPAWLQSMLFPTEADCTPQTKLHRGIFRQKFFDDQLNWEQKRAVEAVCEQDYGMLPYLVSGPPGTGKTKTVIEIALQLIHSDRDSRVLLCAPSETAADTLAIRLRDHFAPAELLRLNRPTRTFAEVPGPILHFCHVQETAFALPPFEKMLTYRVVVSSCRDASLLLQGKVTNSDLYWLEHGVIGALRPLDQGTAVHFHWTALLIDEAAQATEPEALVPITVVAPPAVPCIELPPILVMVGDEHQLAPRTFLSSSPLKMSLFARLFARPVYAGHPLARGKTSTPPPVLKPSMLPILKPAFTNLFRNYRSHPAILATPSALFYHDTLEPEAPGTDRLITWTDWRGRRWPVLFHHNPGNDEIERDGGGWHNPSEVRLALRHATSLVSSKLVGQAEICVMSPFKAQVMQLRAAFRKAALWDVSVGPTEAFQGMEFDVVILCTTRARERFLKKDKEVGWGVVGMANAMNVALTRARYGLVVIGQRELLATDKNWGVFLGFCERNGLVAGEGYGEDWKAPEVVSAEGRPRLEKVMLAQEAEVEAPVGSGALGGVGITDEIWANEIHGKCTSYESTGNSSA